MIAENAGAVSATWYGPGFYGNKTSSGETFTGLDLTAAHPDPSMMGKVVNVKGPSGDNVPVKINDTCACELDLSEAAAEKTGVKDAGRAEVSMEVVGSGASENQSSVTLEKPSENIEVLPSTG